MLEGGILQAFNDETKRHIMHILVFRNHLFSVSSILFLTKR